MKPITHINELIAKIFSVEGEQRENPEVTSHLCPCYLYMPVIDTHCLPLIDRRSQGLSRADGYYWHDNLAAAGLYWVLKALSSMKAKERFPHGLRSSRMHKARAAFVILLSENLTWAIHRHSRKVMADVRHQETYDLIRRLESYGSLQAKAAAADLAKAEAALSASFIHDQGSERNAHLYRLSPNHEEQLQKLIVTSTLDVTDFALAAYRARAFVNETYPNAVKWAASKASDFSKSHKTIKPLNLHDHKDLCRVRSDHFSVNSTSKLITGGNLHDSSPAWANEYLRQLVQTWDDDKLAWEKSVFRLVEPQIRAEEFARFVKKNGRFEPGKAYRIWLVNHGRYSGMQGTNPNGLLTAVGMIDEKVKRLVVKLNLNPPSKRLPHANVLWLEHFSNYAESGKFHLFLAL